MLCESFTMIADIIENTIIVIVIVVVVVIVIVNNKYKYYNYNLPSSAPRNAQKI